MVFTPHHDNKASRPARLPLAGLLALLLWVPAARAQRLSYGPDTDVLVPAAQGGNGSAAPNSTPSRRDGPVVPLPACSSPTVSGFPPSLPLVPSRAAHSPREAASFVESLNRPEGMFEVIVGQGRLLTLREDLAVPGGAVRPLIAVGDPSVVDFTVIGPRQIRLIGLRLGTTDLSITDSANRTFSFQVQVVADLDMLRAQLRAAFPDASLKLGQIHDSVVVEGEARDPEQVAHILETVKTFLVSVQATELRKISGQSAGAIGTPGQPGARQPQAPAAEPRPGQPGDHEPRPALAAALPEHEGVSSVEAPIPEPHIINLLRVPGPQQVMLKVRVAELNRSALRQIGADVLGVDPAGGAVVGSQIGGASISALGMLTGQSISGLASGANSASTTVFGILDNAHFEFLITALRRNSILKVLAEPNLVAMNGQQASFLAGGEFPVPVPQTSSGGAAPAVTVQFREFGVRLGFIPFIQDDGLIRLTVDPEVSSIDFTVGTVLVPGGTPVPGLNTRKSHTTVELRQGQTLAIAGLLQLTVDGQTSRIPGLGDLPVIGPFFSNTSNSRQEKELVVLVTPYLVEPMNHGQVPPAPGDLSKEPTDLEAYFLNRIEGRSVQDTRSTFGWDDPLHIRQLLNLEDTHVRGPHGFCE